MRLGAFMIALAVAAWGCDSASTQTAPREPDPPHAQSPSEPTPEAPAGPMTDRKPQTHLSGVSDAELAGADPDDALDALLDSMTDTEVIGIRIDAPFSTEPGASTLPVIGAFVRRPEQGEAFENRVAVIATSGDAIEVQPALRTPKMKGARKSPATDAVRGSSFTFDARARLPGVDFGAGARLWVGYGAHLSNGVSVRVGGDAPLAPSSDPSLSVTAPSGAPTEPGAAVEVSGTAPASRPVHLVALGGPDAFVVTVDAADDGRFSVNLLGDNPLPKAPGTWHVYAFCGEYAAGPATIALTPGDTPW